MKNIYRLGKLVIKKDPLNLDSAWKLKLKEIMKIWRFHAFNNFVKGGYSTYYVDGVDLQGDRPFKHRHDRLKLIDLSPEVRSKVIRTFRQLVLAGMTTDYFLCDLTPRNIILNNDCPYFIDFDVIWDMKKPLSNDYIEIIQRMLKYLTIDYKFDGGLYALHKVLLYEQSRTFTVTG